MSHFILCFAVSVGFAQTQYTIPFGVLAINLEVAVLNGTIEDDENITLILFTRDGTAKGQVWFKLEQFYG